MPGRTGVAQVPDSRGWVRLPTELLGVDRRPTSWTARPGDEGLVLRPSGGGPARTSAPPPVRVAATTAARPGPDGAGPKAQDAALVSLAGVAAGRAGRTLFEGLDLELRPGSWTALRGPSGSGKSTLLSLVAGLTDPRAGQVAVGGTAWAGLDRATRAAHRGRWLAYGLQRANLVETMSVAENVALATDARGRTADADEVAALVGTLGLTAQLRTPAGVLSGGERQRASLARVLVAGVPVLVLDEPTSQQDDVSAARVVDALTAACAAGAAVLVASHDPAVLERAGAALVL